MSIKIGEHFVGRKEEISKIQEWIDQAALNKEPITITGQEGIGKTELLEWISKSKYRNSHYVKIDLKELKPFRLYEFINAIKQTLEVEYKFQFRAFNMFYSKIISNINPKIDEMKYSTDTLADVVVGFADELGDTVSLYRKGKLLKDILYNILEGNKVKKLGIEENIKAIKTPDDLMSQSIRVLYKDIAGAYNSEFIKEESIVIFIDNYEKVSCLSENERKYFEECVDELSKHESVICIKSMTNSTQLGGYEVKKLCEADVLALLEKVGIINPDIQRTIYEASNGLPGYVVQCINHYTESSKPSDFKDLACMCTQKNWETQLLKSPDTILLLAIPRRWSKELFCHVFPSDIISCAKDFEKLIEQNMMEEEDGPDKYYTLKEIIRTSFKSKLDKQEDLSYYHKHFYDFYITKLMRLPKEDKERIALYFFEAFYHLKKQYKEIGRSFWHYYKRDLQPFYELLTPDGQIELGKSLVDELETAEDLSRNIYRQEVCKLALAYNVKLKHKEAGQVLGKIKDDLGESGKIKSLYYYTLGNTYCLDNEHGEAQECFKKAFEFIYTFVEVTGDYIPILNQIHRIILSANFLETNEDGLRKEYLSFVEKAQERRVHIERIDHRLEYMFQIGNIYHALCNSTSKEGDDYCKEALELYKEYINHIENNYEMSQFHEEASMSKNFKYVQAYLGYIDCLSKMNESVWEHYHKLALHTERTLGSEYIVITHRIYADYFSASMEERSKECILDTLLPEIQEYISYNPVDEMIQVLHTLTYKLAKMTQCEKGAEVYKQYTALLEGKNLEYRIEKHKEFLEDIDRELEREHFILESIRPIIEEDLANWKNEITLVDRSFILEDLLYIAECIDATSIIDEILLYFEELLNMSEEMKDVKKAIEYEELVQSLLAYDPGNVHLIAYQERIFESEEGSEHSKESYIKLCDMLGYFSKAQD